MSSEAQDPEDILAEAMGESMSLEEARRRLAPWPEQLQRLEELQRLQDQLATAAAPLRQGESSEDRFEAGEERLRKTLAGLAEGESVSGPFSEPRWSRRWIPLALGVAALLAVILALRLGPGSTDPHVPRVMLGAPDWVLGVTPEEGQPFDGELQVQCALGAGTRFVLRLLDPTGPGKLPGFSPREALEEARWTFTPAEMERMPPRVRFELQALPANGVELPLFVFERSR